MQIKHIVLATDLSQLASTSYPHAAALAKTFGARVTMMHVDDFEEFGVGGEEAREGDGQGEAFRSQVEALRAKMLAEHTAMLEQHGVDVRFELVRGRPAEVIPALCSVWGADLLVLSKYGARGVDHASASVAAQVVTSTRVPTLVTHAEEGDAPTEQPARYRRVMAPIDFSRDGEVGLGLTLGLVATLQADLFVPHVLRKPFFAHLELPEVSFEHLRASCMETLQTTLARVGAAGVRHEVLIGDEPAHALAELARREDTDLLVLPSHGKHANRDLIGHTTKNLVMLAGCPVLVLPREFLAQQ